MKELSIRNRIRIANVKRMFLESNYNMLQVISIILGSIGFFGGSLVLLLIYKPELVQPPIILLSNSGGYLFMCITLYYLGNKFKRTSN